ncbi:MAG: Nif3-like dinuclear metal center hexameric protein [Phycisphaerae bacterium]|nr:Nif3-like dinuclear metal center hexameric protein [Phycisphaerae bacterium]
MSDSTRTVADLINAMETVAPLAGAEPWDRVGLAVGHPGDELSGPTLLTIDLTETVMEEAVQLGASAIVCYHPPIWRPLERLTDATPAERIVREAIGSNIAIYSPHTALDAAENGLTDWLCEGIAGVVETDTGHRVAADCRALAPASLPSPTRQVKVIVFVPEDKIDQCRSAMATAGAGIIGLYRVCSFSTAGEGTFLPTQGAHPTRGSVGGLERVKERRLEMVCSRSALPLVIETLRQFHPYEEPAFDIVELLPEPHRRSGAGRKLVLDQPATIETIGLRLRAHLDHDRIKFAVPSGDSGDEMMRIVGVVPGAGAGLLDQAAQEGCELFVTGEMKHHDVLAAQAHGISVMLAGHTNTERGYLPRLANRLEALLPGLSLQISETDEDPLRVLA